MTLITNEQLATKLEESPAERVTFDYLKSRIKTPEFSRISDTLTHCRIEIDNGFSVTGESACVNAANYNKEIGEKIAYDNAFQKLWPLFGFRLAEKNFEAKAGLSGGAAGNKS